MLAMQYSFTLPADYDMAIIRRRISDNGHKMDGFHNLLFKAFVLASRDSQGHRTRENLYAPFYLWESNEGINRFLASPGFAALTASFGWPAIKLWSVWQAQLSPEFTLAKIATREIVRIDPHTDLAELQERESRLVNLENDGDEALGSLVGFEPHSWSLVRFRLWRSYKNDLAQVGTQVYEVGYLAN